LREKIVINYQAVPWECDCCGFGADEHCNIEMGYKTLIYHRDDKFGGGTWEGYDMLSALEGTVRILRDLGFEVEFTDATKGRE
jgi:ribulose 1,5-bisphosphate synthetase/thiazole synthase